MPTGNVTYIQNNYYGNSVYGTSYNGGYGYGCNCGCSNPSYIYGGSCFGYGYPTRPHHPKPRHCYNQPAHHCSNNELPTSLKWALGIGVGTTVLGSIIKACGK